MKGNLTQVVFILDRSGSMCGLESDTINGYNAMIEKQKKKKGRALITTILFDDKYELLNDNIDINVVPKMTDKQYYVRGNTALLDAIGKSIQKMINIQKRKLPKSKAEKVIFVINTDGLENASVEYSYDKINSMINYQKKKYKWEFIFLGANIDAVAEANKFGINENCAVNYHADSKGTQINYDAICSVVSEFRESGCIGSKWREELDIDYLKRESNK